jgi:hypothetical protein
MWQGIHNFSATCSMSLVWTVLMDNGQVDPILASTGSNYRHQRSGCHMRNIVAKRNCENSGFVLVRHLPVVNHLRPRPMAWSPFDLAIGIEISFGSLAEYSSWRADLRDEKESWGRYVLTWMRDTTLPRLATWCWLTILSFFWHPCHRPRHYEVAYGRNWCRLIKVFLSKFHIFTSVWEDINATSITVCGSLPA